MLLSPGCSSSPTSSTSQTIPCRSSACSCTQTIRDSRTLRNDIDILEERDAPGRDDENPASVRHGGQSQPPRLTGFPVQQLGCFPAIGVLWAQGNEGAKKIIEKLEESSEPLQFSLWGGAGTLAQALQHIETTKSSDNAALLRSRLRVYAISDQDNTGSWIQARWPDIFYITSINSFNEFEGATWVGINIDDNGFANTKCYGLDPSSGSGLRPGFYHLSPRRVRVGSN
ncbi:hypothetical protein CSAL01_07583 [Colletotrichum salicis]|uniref:Cellulose-binding Sde182 nucleoside hydrolase-like domain-containing protein n=1 Tax=Colletotrichum salicis TaxID=1209931 RepID=A0A135S4Y1_9PEZI|nr:hypothetical protein CSAL01_07583 [Colletotrichum salicis]